MNMREILDRIDEAVGGTGQSPAFFQKQKELRLKRLKAEVEAGKMPIIRDVSGTSDNVFTMGDLENLGWMSKHYTTDPSGEVDGWTRDYFGPKPVRVQTSGATSLKTLNPGDTLD